MGNGCTGTSVTLLEEVLPMLGGAVPWSVETIQEQRLEFCLAALSEAVAFVELCRRFGISPKTGYKWLARFDEGGRDGLADLSRRPRQSPSRTSEAMENLVCELRREHPSWGGRKISRRLKDRGEIAVPAPSTITDILRRNDLLRPVEAHYGGFVSFEAEHPNDMWQMDFKGWFNTTHSGRCHPFDVLDDHSRYNLCLFAALDETESSVKAQLMRTFDRYGLPLTILCDNGPPWGSTGSRTGVTHLGVWLIDLGIKVIHARPRHPQTLGKDERFHRTLNLEVISRRPAWDNHTEVQTAFDQWRTVYNHQRPHDSLQGGTPATRYQPSTRSMPTQIQPPDYPDDYQVRKVASDARVHFKGARYRIGKPYAGLAIAFVPTTIDDTYNIVYRHHHIGTINLKE